MTDQTAFNDLVAKMMSLYADKKFAEMLALLEENQSRFPEQYVHTTFWRMCFLSLCNRPEEVLSLLRHELDNGMWWAANQFLDPDFDAVRDMTEFKRLVNESNRRCIEARASTQPDRTLLLPDQTPEAMPLLIALHGRNGNKDSSLENWDVARRRGWLVLLPQSQQIIFPGNPAGYCWDDNDEGMSDILFHVEEIMRLHPIDRERIVIAGFSQGSGMAIYAALSGKVSVRGFIGVGTFMIEPSALDLLASDQPPVRGYFITGENDGALEKTREIQNILAVNQIPFSEEIHPNLGHEFPADFESSFAKAMDFIFKETE
jgi:predicted esterase